MKGQRNTSYKYRATQLAKQMNVEIKINVGIELEAPDGFILNSVDGHFSMLPSNNKPSNSQWRYALEDLEEGLTICNTEDGEPCEDCQKFFDDTFGNESDAVIALLEANTDESNKLVAEMFAMWSIKFPLTKLPLLQKP